MKEVANVAPDVIHHATAIAGGTAPDSAPTTSLDGLSDEEAAARRAKGQGNEFRLRTSRSYAQILRYHGLSFINVVLFVVGGALVLLGRFDDALLTAGMVGLNVILGVGQEGRAKRKLDQIALLTRPRATVVRSGQAREIDPREIVLGDVLQIGAGDQIVVDGQVVGPGRLEVDESLLTGESDRVPKRAGDLVFSGSYCVSGSAVFVTTKVGAASLANQMVVGARAFRQIKTPLQRDVDYVVRLLLAVVVQLGVLFGISLLRGQVSLVEGVQEAAVLAGLVPQGLFAMITVTYAMGALRISSKGALIQQINAVESLSHVNVLCLDKTGTLTSNKLSVEETAALDGGDKDRLNGLLADFVASVSEGNRTAEAIGAAFSGRKCNLVAEAPFSSARKWSALCFDDPQRPGVYVLGAPEMLRAALLAGADLGPKLDEWSAQGLRVLLFAYQPEARLEEDATGEPLLPAGLVPLGLVSMRDELRPEAEQTLRSFVEAGVRLKIISGDSPATVAALAQQASMGADLQTVSGLELAAMDNAQFAQAAERATVFGRITPEQKQKLVRVLRDGGNYVAMIGDGVNDVLSLKQAHIGIAMNSGSQATRAAADIVLLDDSFAVLPAAVQEGRRILSGMQDVLRLVLAHSTYITLLIIACGLAGLAFPTTPKLRSMITLLTVGVPTVLIASWARPQLPSKGSLRSVLRFVLPAGFAISAAGFGVYYVYLQNSGDVGLARSALTALLIFCGLVLIPFVEPPSRGWVAGDEFSGDRRPLVAAGAMLVVFAIAMFIPPARAFFQLSELPILDFLLIGFVVVVWAIVLRVIWRQHFFEQLFTSPR